MKSVSDGAAVPAGTQRLYGWELTAEPVRIVLSQVLLYPVEREYLPGPAAGPGRRVPRRGLLGLDPVLRAPWQRILEYGERRAVLSSADGRRFPVLLCWPAVYDDVEPGALHGWSAVDVDAFSVLEERDDWRDTTRTPHLFTARSGAVVGKVPTGH